MIDVSHPIWVRGLKRSTKAIDALSIMSHPIWVRGLKLWLQRRYIYIPDVAPHMGAWIETLATYCHTRLQIVAPHMGAWIETSPLLAWMVIRLVAPHMGAWIETFNFALVLSVATSRTPYGCVD